MTPQALLEILRQEAETKGFYLHADMEHCIGTAESLLISLEKHGYMCCPCRLATGCPNSDSDMICPCAYRDEDVIEFGACYCSLFVSEEHKDDPEFFPDVDERRPPEKFK